MSDPTEEEIEEGIDPDDWDWDAPRMRKIILLAVVLVCLGCEKPKRHYDFRIAPDGKSASLGFFEEPRAKRSQAEIATWETRKAEVIAKAEEMDGMTIITCRRESCGRNSYWEDWLAQAKCPHCRSWGTGVVPAIVSSDPLRPDKSIFSAVEWTLFHEAKGLK